MSEQLALLPGYLTAHLQLTLLALLLGTGISVPLGVLATRVRWLERPLMGVASAIQTIPSLALLAIMVPLLSVMHLQGIGFLPAAIGLLLYSMLPILRNTLTGIDSVEAALIEAARGVGMTPGQQLRRVEIPLAMPVIVAGIRTATVWTVGTATLSTPVGAPSLGNYIFTGLHTRNFTSVVVGCVAASLLALLLDGLVGGLELAARRRNRTLAGVVLGVIGALYVYSGATFAGSFFAKADEPVTIGAKTFTEQYILSEIIARHIHRETGSPTKVVQSLGSTVAFDALRTGQIDVYVDYSGTIWATIMKRDTVPEERGELLHEVRRFLRDRYAVTLAAVLGFENAYALAMRERDAGALGIHRISDLVPHAPRLSIGGDYEFFGRAEWRALRDAYNLSFADQRSMDPSLMYQAAAAGQVDVISAFSTDGRIEALNLVVLEDDRAAIPPYDAVILAGPKLSAAHSNVLQALGELDGTIDAELMRSMNLAVDERGESPGEVAERFLDRVFPQR